MFDPIPAICGKLGPSETAQGPDGVDEIRSSPRGVHSVHIALSFDAAVSHPRTIKLDTDSLAFIGLLVQAM